MELVFGKKIKRLREYFFSQRLLNHYNTEKDAFSKRIACDEAECIITNWHKNKLVWNGSLKNKIARKKERIKKA